LTNVVFPEPFLPSSGDKRCVVELKI